MRTPRSLLAALAALIAGLAIVPAAQADFFKPDPLRNYKNENYCLGIGGGSTADGAKAGLFRCDGKANQQYTFEGTRTSAQIEINHGTDRCLRIGAVSDGGLSRLAEQGKCNDYRAFWRVTNLTPEGHFGRLATIESKAYPNLCIGVGGGAIFHGNVIKAYKCGNAPFSNQGWVVNPNGQFVP